MLREEEEAAVYLAQWMSVFCDRAKNANLLGLSCHHTYVDTIVEVEYRMFSRLNRQNETFQGVYMYHS